MHRVFLVAIAVAALGCSSSSSDAATTDGGNSDGSAGGGTLDCAFFAGANCFTTFVDSVAECLGSAGGATGVMDIDSRTCTYPSGGRVVSFATPLGMTIDGGSNGSADVHFIVTVGDEKCLDHLETKGDLGFESVGPSGKFKLSYDGNTATVACPD